MSSSASPSEDVSRSTEPQTLSTGPSPAASLDSQALAGLTSISDSLPLRAQATVSSIAAMAGAPPALVVPGHEILDELGRGAMGIVFKARQMALNRLVALKMILPGSYAARHEMERFRAEAEMLARLKHPHIVHIYEVGEQADCPFIVLEYLEGGNLAAKIRGTPQAPREAAQLVQTLARAIHAAHQCGIVHRDLKPHNILLTADGTPKISDFGIAKIVDAQTGQTASSAVLGTPSYMAPEQASGQSRTVGPAADVYALGAILYELLTGQPPFRGTSILETLEQVRTREPVPVRQLQPKVPRDLETICLLCLRKEPARRYPDAEALAGDLARFLEGKTVQARPVSRTERAWRWCRRNPALAVSSALAMAALTLALGLLVGLALYQARVASELRDKQQATAAALSRAEDNFHDARRQWALLAMDRGLTLCEDGDAGRGMLFLSAGLEYAHEADDAELEQFLRLSLGAWRRQIIPLRGIVSLPAAQKLVLFSPNGRTVLTAEDGPRALLWDTARGKAVGQPLSHQAPIRAAVFSPEGKTVATGSEDRTVRLWSADSGRPIGKPVVHADAVVAVAFAPDGRVLLTACADNTIRLWDAESGQARSAALMQAGSIQAIAFSPDGRTILTSVKTGASEKDRTDTVQLWDVRSGEPRGKPIVHEGVFHRTRFTPNSQAVLTCGWDRKEKETRVRLWSASTGAPLGDAITQKTRVECLAFHPGGAKVLLSDGPGLQIWEMAAGAAAGPSLKPAGSPLHGHRGAVLAAAFSPDGRFILSGGRDGVAQFWDADRGQRLGESLEHQGPVTGVAFAPDGKTLLTRSDDNMVRLWEGRFAAPLDVRLADGGKPAANPASPVSGRRAAHVAFSPDGRLVLRMNAGQIGNVVLQDAVTGRLLGSPLSHQGTTAKLQFAPDGLRLLTCPTERTVQVWDTTSGAAVGLPLPHAHPISIVAWSADSKTILTGCGGADRGEVRLWNAATGKPLSSPLVHPCTILSAGFSPDGKTVLTGAWDQTARFWDIATAQQMGPILAHENAVTTVAFSPNGETVLTTSAKGATRLWRARTGEPIGKPLPHLGKLNAVAYSPRGDVIVTASGEPEKGTGEARLWSAASAEPIGRPLPHQDAVDAVAFSPDGKMLLTGSSDYTARLWDVATASPIGPPLVKWLEPIPPPVLGEPEPGSGVAAVAFSADGQSLLTAGRDERVRIWRAPRPLTGEPPHIRTWARVISGKDTDRGGATQFLTAADWCAFDRTWRDLGGLGQTEPTMVAPVNERRKRIRDPFVEGPLGQEPTLLLVAPAGG